jgi:predicted dehydrogenase
MKIVILGDGSAGTRHAKLLREIDDTIKVFVWGPTDPNELLKVVADAYIIASPPDTHREYLKVLESCDTHILCEGPVSYLPKNPYQRIHMTASNWRFVTSMSKIAYTQRITPIIAHFWFDYDLRNWRPEISITQTCYYSSGIHRINVHEIDMALWLCGPADEYNHVRYRTYANISKSSDACTFMIRHKTNCLTTINSSWIGKRYSRGLRLVYSDGKQLERVWRSPQHDAEVNESYLTQLIHFLYCIQNNRMPNVTLEDGYNAYLIACEDDDDE